MRVFLRLKYLFLVRYSFAFFLVEHALLGRITLLGVGNSFFNHA